MNDHTTIKVKVNATSTERGPVAYSRTVKVPFDGLRFTCALDDLIEMMTKSPGAEFWNVGAPQVRQPEPKEES